MARETGCEADLSSSSRLCISVVEPSGLLYGSELALCELLEGLDRSRFDVEIIVPRGAPLAARLRGLDIRCVELLVPARPGKARLYKLIAYTRLLLHWIACRPSLIYVNQGGILRPIALIARPLKLPIVCQIQTLEDALWVSRLGSEHRDVRAFVCNSDFIASRTRVPLDRLNVVYHGYKSKHLLRPHRLRVQRPFVVGVIGRICRSKGHDLIVEAARTLKQNGEGGKVRFRFIGEAASEDEQSEFREMIKTAGVCGDIEYRGYRSDIAAELEQLDLLAIPSRAEPMGRVLFEAAEARVPVLVAKAGGLWELAEHFQIGVTFESGNAVALLMKLGKMFQEFQTISLEFDQAAGRMLRSLDFDEYISVMEQILSDAADLKPCAIRWTGLAVQGY